MNKKGFIEIDEGMIIPIALAILGGFVAYFTATGGFSSMWGQQFDPGLATKVLSALGGAIIGFVWGYVMVNR